jgi:hypothetical protein
MNNETAARYPAIEETLGVSLGYMSIGWAVLFAAAVYWRQTESMDESKNNWGLLQWSSMFYCEGGAVMDFINALPHIMNLIPTATVYMGVSAYEHTGNPYWTFLTFFAGFGLVPILDLLIGEDSYNPTKKEEIAMRHNNWFRFHTVLYVWIYVLSVCHFAKYVGENFEVNSIAF